MTLQTDNIRFAIPIDIEKGKNVKGEETYFFKGLASTPEKDTQNEELFINQFDLSDFKQVNWNHKGKDNSGAVIGQIDNHKFIKKGLFVEGELYPEMEMTKSTVNLMKALKKRGKQMQLSIEGSVLKRGSEDKKHPDYNKILKAKLTGVAMTPAAINQSTFAELIEKGLTNNDWQYEQPLDEIMKSMDEKKLLTEEDIEKAMVAGHVTGTETANQALTAQPLKAESLEGKKSKKCTCDGKNICQHCIDEANKKVLSKSCAYELIYDYFCPVSSSKATQIFNLAQKIATMADDKKEITQEVLEKAFDIINLAAEQSKVPEKTIDSAIELIKSVEFEGLEKAEVIEKLEKAGYDEDMSNEAYDKQKPSPKKKKAKKKDEDDDEDEVKKSFDALKLQSEEFQNNSDLKMGAIGVILKSQTDAIDKLTAANEALATEIATIKETTEKISTSPIRKSLISANAIERFEKSKDGEQIYNLKSRTQRKALADKIEVLSNFNNGQGVSGTGKYDEALMKASQEVEMLGVISDARTITYLEDVHKVKIVNE